MANKLPHSKRVQSLNRLNEGMSLRAISRLQDMSINTVTKRFVDAGETCLDLKRRLVGRVQLTADGHVAYPGAVAAGFGKNVDFAQLIKTYGEDPSRGPERKYSPPGLPGAPKVPVIGNPDPAHISTSYVELANLTMQMGMRRHPARATRVRLKQVRTTTCPHWKRTETVQKVRRVGRQDKANLASDAIVL